MNGEMLSRTRAGRRADSIRLMDNLPDEPDLQLARIPVDEVSRESGTFPGQLAA